MANKDPSKNDVKFNDEIDTDLDNYDSDIAEFFEEDIDGADKDRSPVEKTLRSIKRNIKQAGSDALEGAGEGIKASLKTTMPKVKETWDAAEEVSSEVDTIKQAVMDKAMPVWNQTKRMLRTMGNKFGSQMPFGIDKAILKIAGEEEEAAPKELSKEETRNQNIQNTMGEIFKLQEKKSMEQQKDAILNRTLDRRIGQIHHKEDVSLLGTIAQQATFNTSFTKSVFTAYLKKDLELKYRSFYVATDTLEVMKVGLESLEKRLDAISKNTALPDADKLYMSERITGNLKSKLASGFNDKIQNIISKTANNLKEKIFGGLDAAEMGIGAFSQLIGMMQGPEDGMGGFGDDSLTPMGMLKSFLFQSIGTALGKNLTNMAVGKLPKGFANQLNTMLRGGGKQGITQLLLEVQKGRYKLPEKLQWIQKLIPNADEILGKPQLYNDTYDNLDKGGKLTNKTIATIEEIIPGYLRMQTKFLEAIATKTVGKDKLKNTQEQYYDFKTMRFKAANVLKQEYKKEITERLTSSNVYEARDLHERTRESMDYIFDNLGGPDSEANKNAFERVLNDEKYTKSIYQFLYNIAYSSEYGILTESDVESDLAGLYDWLCTGKNKYDQKDKKMPESVKRFGSIALNGIDKPDQQKQAIWYWYLLLTVVDPEESDDTHVARKANSNAITSINTLLTTIKGQGAEEALVNTMDDIKKSGHLSLIADDYTTVNSSGNLDIKSDVLARMRTSGADGVNNYTNDILNEGLSEEERKQWKNSAWKTEEEMAELTSKQGKSIIESFWDSIKSGGSAILEKTGLKEGFGEIKDALAGAAGDVVSSAKDSALDVASTLHRGLAILRDIVSHDKDGNPLETGKYRDLKDLTDKEWNAWATQIGSLMDFAQILNKHKGNPILELIKSAMPKQLRRIFDAMGDGDELHSQDNEVRERIKELNEQYKEDLANISEDEDSDAYYQAVSVLNENYAQQVTELINNKEQSLKELQDRDINNMLKSAKLDDKEKQAKKEQKAANKKRKRGKRKKHATGFNTNSPVDGLTSLAIDDFGGYVDQETSVLGGTGIAGEAGGETIIPHKNNERFKELIYKCVKDTVDEQTALRILMMLKPSKELLKKLHITASSTDTPKFASGGIFSKVKNFLFGDKTKEEEDKDKVVTEEKKYKREYGIDETNDILKNILLVNEAMYDRMKSGLMSIDALRYVDPKNLRNVIGNLRNSGFFGSLRNFVSATTDLVSAPVAGAWGLATGAVTNSLGMARHMLFNKTCDVYRAPPLKGAKPDPVKDLLIRKEAFETGVFKDEKLSKPIKSVADLTIPAYGYDKDGSPKTLIDVGDAPNGLCDVNGKPLVSSGGVVGRTIHNVVKGIFSTMGVNIHLKDIWKGIGDFKRGLIDPYCDVYSFRDPDTALVSGDDIKEGLIVTIDPKDGEKSVVKDVFDIKGVCHKLEIDPSNPSKRILSAKPVIEAKDINAGLCDINRHPIKSSLLTKFGLLFRKTGGKVFGAIGSVIEKSAKGMGAVVSTLWNAGTWVVSHAFDFTVKAFKSKNKFIDVYVVRNGKKECVIRGDDLKDNKDTKKYIYRDGEPVTSAYGIKKEVISWFSEDGNTQLKEARIVISTTDIDNGLFDEEGHKLTAFAGKSLVGKLASVGMGVLKFAGGKALKLGIGALKMTGKVISALGSILGEGGAVVTGWIGNIWNQTIDLFKSSLISRIDLEEIVGRRLADIYGLLYNWMPRRESDDKDGDGLLDNRYKEWKEGKRRAKEKKEESKKDKDDEKKPGFFARLFGGKDKEGGGEGDGGDSIFDDILETYFYSKMFGGGKGAAAGGGKVGLLKRMFGWLPFGKKAAAAEGAAGKAAGKAAGEAAGKGGAIKNFFKKTWSKLGFGGRTAASAGSKGLIRAGAGLVLKTALKMATGLGFAWLAADAIGLTYKLTKDDTRVVAMRNVRFPAYGVNTKYWEAIEDLETDTFSELSDGNDTGVDEKRLRQFGYKIDFLNDAELSVGGNKLSYLKAWYTKRFMPAYKTYCKTLMSIRDAIAIQEYSSDPDADRNNPPEQDLSQPKADDIPDTMFGESCQQIEKALQPYSENDAYILDGEHFEAWMAEMSERAEEAGIGDSLKYDEAALVDENTKIFGSATANFSYAWTELKHGNLLNSAAAATKGVLGTIGKLVKGYIEFQQSLINLGEWTDWSTEVSKYEQIWEEIRFKLYGFDVANEDADTKKRFSEQFRVIEADQVHFIDKEQPEPTKEEFEAWTDAFFTDADLEKVRYKVLNEGIDESEIRGGFRDEAKKFIISWWRRIFLPVFTAYATTVRVTAGAEPGDAIVVDDIPEDARSAALKEFEKNANDLLRSNKLDTDILKLSIDGFANYLIERCQSDVAEYDKDSANLKTSMDESFGTLLSKGLNQSGQHFSRAWTALKDFRFKTAIKESIKGIKEGAVGIYNAVAEGMGSGISDFLHGSVTAGKFIERFYDYGFPDMSGHTDFFEPDHVKAARKFELRVAQSWRAGYKDEIEDEHFNSIMRSTHLLRDIIKEAGAVSKPTGGPAVKSMRSSPASNKAYERVENVLSYGKKYSHTRIISIMKSFLDEESIKLVAQAYEYLKFWLKIRMEKVFSAFASVVSGYGVELDPMIGSIDTDDIPADKREEAYAAYQKKKEGLLDKSVKFYMLTSQGFFKYRDDLKKVAEDMKVGKAPSVAPMAKQLEEMRKQRKKQEDSALANLSVKLSPVMRKTGSDLKKMITDTSDIDVAVEDAKTMSNEAADEVIRTLGMTTFTNGKTMSQRDSLIAVFNTAIALGADGSENNILNGVKQLQESAYEFIFSADTKQSEQEDKLKSLVTDFTKIILEYGNKQGARDIYDKELKPVQFMYGHAGLQKLGITVLEGTDILVMTYNDLAQPSTMFYTYMACWFGKVFVPIYVYFVLAVNRLLNQTIGAKPDLNALNKVQIAQLIKILRNVRNKINLGKFAKLYLNHGVRKEDLIGFFDQWLTDEKKESDARKSTREDREAARKSEADKKKQQEAEQAAQQKQTEDARRSREEEIRKANAQRGTDSPESQKMADGVKQLDKTVNNVLNPQPTDPYAPVNNDTSGGSAGNTPVQDNIGKPEYNDPLKPNAPEAPTKEDTLNKSMKEQQRRSSRNPVSNGGGGDVPERKHKAEPDSNAIAAKLWRFFKSKGWTDEAIAGILGNFHKESAGIHTVIVQNDLNKSRKVSIAYTERADNSTKAEILVKGGFARDSKGYGLAQWTYSSRKEDLWRFAHSKGKSVGDPDIQIEFLYDELTAESGGKIAREFILRHKSVTNRLKNTTDLREATDIILLKFEKPASVTEYNKSGTDSTGSYHAELYERLGWAKYWYDKFHNKNLDDMSGTGDELKSPYTPEQLMAEEAKKKAGGNDTSDRLKAAGRRLVRQAEKHERAEEQAEQNEERTNQGKKQKGNPKNVKKIVKGSKPARGSFASPYGGKDTGAAASASAGSGSPKFNYKGVTIPQSREEAIQILKSLPSMKGAKTSYGGKDWKSVGNLSTEFLKRLAVGGQLAEQSGKQKPWTITSAFRTYKEQAALKLKYPKDAARPGTSRHETGIAIDLGDGSFGGIKNKPYDRGTSVDQIEPFLKAVGITRRYRPGKLNEAQHFELAQGKLPDLQQFATDSGAAAAQDAAKEIKDTLPPTDNNAKEAATTSRKASSALDSKDTSAAEVSVSAAEAPRTAAVSSGASAGVSAAGGSDFITQELGNLQDQLGLSGTSTNPASTDTTGVLPSHIPSNRADIMDITDIGKRPDHIPHMAELPDHLYGTTEYFDEDYKGGKLPDYIPGHYANLDDMPGIGQLPSNIPNMAVLPDYVPGAIIQQEKAYVPGTLPSHIAGKLPNLDDIYDTGVLPGYIPKMSELPDHLYGTTEYYDENYTPGKLPGHIPGHYANLDDMPGIGELPKNIPGHYTNLDDLPGVGQLPSHIPNISTLPSNIPYLRTPQELARFARTRNAEIARKARDRNTLGILPGHIPNMATLPDHIPGVMGDLKESDGTQTATAPITPTLNLPNDQLKNNTAQFIDRALADLKNSNAAQPAPANTAASRYASNVNTSTFSRTNTGVSTASYTQADVDRTKDGSTPVVAELRLITEVVRNILAFMQSKYTDREKEKQGANSLTTPTLTKEEASFWDKLTPEAFAKLIVSAMQSAAPANAPAAAPAPHTATSMARAPMNYPLNTSKS